MAVACGVCFETVAEVGELDCCDHRFCWPCITCWAERETRCPFCKRRFDVLRRKALLPASSPAKRRRGQGTGDAGGALPPASPPRGPLPGRVLQVLKCAPRDQAYVPEGQDGLTDFLAQLRCRVCGGEQDEELLLICDGCDGGYHTYCVGRDTVPLDDFYCPACVDAGATTSSSDASEGGRAELAPQQPTQQQQRQRQQQQRQQPLPRRNSAQRLRPPQRRLRRRSGHGSDSGGDGGSSVDLTLQDSLSESAESAESSESDAMDELSARRSAHGGVGVTNGSKHNSGGGGGRRRQRAALHTHGVGQGRRQPCLGGVSPGTAPANAMPAAAAAAALVSSSPQPGRLLSWQQLRAEAEAEEINREDSTTRLLPGQRPQRHGCGGGGGSVAVGAAAAATSVAPASPAADTDVCRPSQSSQSAEQLAWAQLEAVRAAAARAAPSPVRPLSRNGTAAAATTTTAAAAAAAAGTTVAGERVASRHFLAAAAASGGGGGGGCFPAVAAVGVSATQPLASTPSGPPPAPQRVMTPDDARLRAALLSRLRRQSARSSSSSVGCSVTQRAGRAPASPAPAPRDSCDPGYLDAVRDSLSAARRAGEERRLRRELASASAAPAAAAAATGVQPGWRLAAGTRGAATRAGNLGGQTWLQGSSGLLGRWLDGDRGGRDGRSRDGGGVAAAGGGGGSGTAGSGVLPRQVRTLGAVRRGAEVIAAANVAAAAAAARVSGPALPGNILSSDAGQQPHQQALQHADVQAQQQQQQMRQVTSRFFVHAAPMHAATDTAGTAAVQRSGTCVEASPGLWPGRLPHAPLPPQPLRQTDQGPPQSEQLQQPLPQGLHQHQSHVELALPASAAPRLSSEQLRAAKHAAHGLARNAIALRRAAEQPLPRDVHARVLRAATHCLYARVKGGSLSLEVLLAAANSQGVALAPGVYDAGESAVDVECAVERVCHILEGVLSSEFSA